MDRIITKKWNVITLSGVSSGGKSMIAKKLLSDVPGTVLYIGQDEYILPNDYPGHLKAPEPLHGLNKDSLHSIDMTKMVTDIRFILENDPMDVDISNSPLPKNRKDVIGSALGSPRPSFHGYRRESTLTPLLILDGFLLLNHPDVPSLCDLKYFITLTKEQCWDRRKHRVFTSQGMDAVSYFEDCMWPMYEKHLKEMIHSVQDIKFIDGALPFEETYQKIHNDIMKKVNRQS